ncbi:hypothetical protein OCF84_20745 (plasmid) [Shewanella xiamenensis]|uniref:Uncharacterized protein n=1 Tax=Shewanella xiamenensis TaxID=332186 RepID=A0ABT6UFQ4_9GAMM|nr:hypothetical protein [Shewanella xiamenensis]MDI5833303.1 hypothetical protein [Shewanella xiamenensis]WHF57947.1 hypothetical protein OCF84_20745 [Shewanella xiamenensis]
MDELDKDYGHSALDAAQEVGGELDLSQYAELDHDDEPVIRFEEETPATSAAPVERELSTEQRQSGTEQESNSPSKKKVSGRTWFLVGMISLIVGAVGFPIVSNYMESNSNDEPDSKSVFIETKPKQVTAQSATSEHSPQSRDNVTSEVNDLKSKLNEFQKRYDSAFIAVNEVLKSKDQEIGDLKNQLKSLQATTNTGGQQITEQSERFLKIEADQAKLISRVSKLESNAASVAKKAKAEIDKRISDAKRAQYEVMTVITGKIRLRNAGTGNERNYTTGDQLEGFGKIKSISISGCITFENNEILEPIGATCKI